MAYETKYILVAYDDSEEFEKMVNKRLAEGWVLYGSICCTVCENYRIYAQGMIMETSI